jgi:hypothetical protein
MVGAIGGLSLRFILKDLSDNSWIEYLPLGGLVLGLLISWKKGISQPLSPKLNKLEESADDDG